MCKIISFIGIPGSGESTQIQLLTNNYKQGNYLVASIPYLVKKDGLLNSLLTEDQRVIINQSQDKINDSRLNGELAPFALDQILFNIINNNAHNYDLIIMDVCPRGIRQAKYFWQLLDNDIKKNYYIFVLNFENNETEKSYERQFQRDLIKRGIDEAILRKE